MRNNSSPCGRSTISVSQVVRHALAKGKVSKGASKQTRDSGIYADRSVEVETMGMRQSEYAFFRHLVMICFIGHGYIGMGKAKVR